MIGGRTFISKFTERRRTSSSEHHKLCLRKIFKKKASWDLIIHPEDKEDQAAVLLEAASLLVGTESATIGNHKEQGTNVGIRRNYSARLQYAREELETPES